MLCVDSQTDAVLNSYVYDGLGNVMYALESFGNFGVEFNYGYDQRGLLVSMIYPNEKVVTYTRDAMGRVSSVSYDGRVVVEYRYLGDTVTHKTMAEADMKYTAAIDTLGRVTGETYSRISRTQTVLDYAYDYDAHSQRLNERNGIDYDFDTLGRVVSEDSTSYTCDILGNPTNAASGGFVYTLDEEERIVQVDNSVGTIAVYTYDRLGRRAIKTIGEVATRFVYDQFGNILCEYENEMWAQDYVYGAKGESVYMEVLDEAPMNLAYVNFFSFLEAWLCWPDCTQDHLAWDANSDSQVNLIDWAAHDEDFEGAFDFYGTIPTTGRYLLTDFRNSVVAKITPNRNADEITYTAFGTPIMDPQAPMEGLAVLWNGYYYDYETGNYYLRNRYYSPLERRFLTEDPHGINPDGNWNNPFFPRKQYMDGYGLNVYAKGDPVNEWDGWGLKSYNIGFIERDLWFDDRIAYFTMQLNAECRRTENSKCCYRPEVKSVDISVSDYDDAGDIFGNLTGLRIQITPNAYSSNGQTEKGCPVVFSIFEGEVKILPAFAWKVIDPVLPWWGGIGDPIDNAVSTVEGRFKLSVLVQCHS